MVDADEKGAASLITPAVLGVEHLAVSRDVDRAS